MEPHASPEIPSFSFNLGGAKIGPSDIALGHLMNAAFTLSIATLHTNVQVTERMIGLAEQDVRKDSSPFNTTSADIALHDLMTAAIAYAESLGYTRPAT